MKRDTVLARKSGQDVLAPPKAAAESMIWSKPPLLRSERPATFRALLDGFSREIKPHGIIEEMYVNDIAWLVWEIIRLRRCRTPIIKASYRQALEDLLTALISYRGRAVDLSRKWFGDQQGKEEVIQILNDYDLDESAIEAEAVRRSSRDLEMLERLLMGLEARRDKALACIADYRLSFGRQLRESSDRVLEAHATDVSRLEDSSVTTSPE